MTSNAIMTQTVGGGGSPPTKSVITFSAGGAGDQVWTHTESGQPEGVIVQVIQAGGGTDEVTSVDYGGVSLTEVSGSPLSGGAGAVYCYFKGDSLPSGNQTVTVTCTTGSIKVGTCTTLNASGNTAVNDSDGTINSASLANPSVTLSLGGIASFCQIAFVSGQDDPASITPLSGWTSEQEADFGTQTGGLYTYDTVGTADVTAGWTQTADNAYAIAVAVKLA